MFFSCHNLSCLVLKFVFAVACHPITFVYETAEKLSNCLQNIMFACFTILIFAWKKSEEAVTMAKAYESLLPPDLQKHQVLIIRFYI